MFTRRIKLLVISMATIFGLVVLAGCSNDHMDGSMQAGSGAMGAEVMFAQMMIPHHEQAVEMSTLAETRASDPWIKELAAEIKGAQAPEIELMASWLDEWGYPQMSGMEAMSAHGGHGMSGMLTQEQLDELAGLTGSQFDQKFAEYMIEHHIGAIEMARGVENSTDPAVAELASNIITSQQAEIDEMNSFLAGEKN